MQIDGGLVLDTLRRACSQDAGVLKPAEQQLQQWEAQPGFYSTLMNIFCNHAVDVNTRWLAVLYFKNGVDRYWRRMAPNALSDHEKGLLREGLISNFTEPVHQIAIQLSVLIAKVARLDCPRHWPELMPRLLEAVRCNDSFIHQRALLVFHQVIKSLASRRLVGDRRVFEGLTTEVFEFMFLLWEKHTTHFLEEVSRGDAHAAALSLDRSILTLKVLRKLVTFGIKDLSSSETALSFINVVLQRTEQILKTKGEIGECNKDLLDKRVKKLTLLTKVLLETQECHPDGFVRFIQPALELVIRYSFTVEGSGLNYERFTVNCLNLMRAILRCDVYRPAKDIEDTKNPVTMKAYEIKTSFFTPPVLTEICHRLIGHYFLLTSEDLQNWDADPEEYLSEEGGDSWKFSIRPCTENLYLTLMKEFRTTLTPVVLQMMQLQQDAAATIDLEPLLQKDAVYNAFGLAAFDLYDDVDFDSLFQRHLLAELKISHPNYRIIRRRVVWLMAAWVGVKMSLALRPALYEAILPLLDPAEDLVVRMEAAYTLKVAIDDFEFKPEHLFPYLESSFGMLFQLLQDVCECETKMQILHVMSFIIERMQAEIGPHCGVLVRYLPTLWASSTHHNMLRCAIISTLTCLVQSMGDLSVQMYDLLLPVIQLSTDVSQEPHVYLCEDGLDLWYTTLQCSPVMTPGLLTLYTNMPPLLEYGTEMLRTCVKIIEAYILLNPAEFLQMYSGSLVKSLSSILTELRTEGVVLIYKLVELILKVFPEEGPALFVSMLPNIASSLINGQDHYPMVTSLHLAIFSRIILHNQAFFWAFIEQHSQQAAAQTDEVVGRLLDSWLDKLDNLIQPERRKLSTMALLSLLTTNAGAVLERFAGCICAVVEVLHDVYRSDPTSDDPQETDCLVVELGGRLSADDLDTAQDRRLRKLTEQDPVYKIDLRTYVCNQLTLVQQQQGHDGWERLLETVDSDIVQQLQYFLQSTPKQ